MATTIDFSGIDFDSGSLELTIVNSLGAVSALLEGPTANSIKVPVAGDFVWTAADLLPTGWTWGEAYNIKFTMPDASTIDFPFNVGGKPAVRLQTLVDGTPDAYVDIPDLELESIESFTWLHLCKMITDNPGYSTIGFRLGFDATLAGQLCIITKNKGVDVSAYSTTEILLDVDGNADFVVFDSTDPISASGGFQSFTGVGRLLSLLAVGELADLRFRIQGFTALEYSLPLSALPSPFNAESLFAHDMQDLAYTQNFIQTVFDTSTTASYCPQDDSETYDLIAIRPYAGVLDSSVLGATRGATFSNGRNIPSFAVIDGLDTYVIPSFDTPQRLANALADEPVFAEINPKWLVMEEFSMAPHIRGSQVLTRVGGTDLNVTVSPSAAPIVIAMYDSIGGDWLYSTSEAPGVNEYTAPLLIPGAHSITMPGGVTITHWAIIPIRGNASLFYVGETVEAEDSLAAMQTALIRQHSALGVSPADSLETYWGAALFTEASLGWTAGGVFTVNVDSANLSGLGTDTYTITIVP